MPRSPNGVNAPGGVNGVMCDGSVRFVITTVSGGTYRALLTADAGDVPGADF